MNPVPVSLLLAVLLLASILSVIGAGGSCKVKCDDSDVCMGPASGSAPPVCLRELQVGWIHVFSSDPFRNKLLTCKEWFKYHMSQLSF